MVVWRRETVCEMLIRTGGRTRRDDYAMSV
jgi:hypothetical protein